VRPFLECIARIRDDLCLDLGNEEKELWQPWRSKGSPRGTENCSVSSMHWEDLGFMNWQNFHSIVYNHKNVMTKFFAHPIYLLYDCTHP